MIDQNEKPDALTPVASDALLESWFDRLSDSMMWAYYNHAVVNATMTRAAMEGMTFEEMLLKLVEVQLSQNREMNEKLMRAAEQGFRL